MFKNVNEIFCSDKKIGAIFTLFGLSVLAVEAYGFALLRSCVRAWRDIWRSAHQIFLKFGTKLHLGEAKKMFQADFWKKFSFSRFWPKTANLCHFWPFLAKNQVFGHFLRIRTSDLSKTWSESWDSCFESFNGSVVSRKILVLAVLAIFGSKIHCLWWHYGFRLFLAIFSKPSMIFC